MATSSIGTTTVVKREYGSALLEAVRRRKALAQARGEAARHGSISEVRAVGMRR
jgi:hypothetical protein